MIKGSETVCDFLQRQVAQYGDDDGKLISEPDIKLKYLIQEPELTSPGPLQRLK